LLRARNDLAKSQKEMVDLMKGMKNTRAYTLKEPLNGEGSNNVEGSHAHTYI